MTDPRFLKPDEVREQFPQGVPMSWLTQLGGQPSNELMEDITRYVIAALPKKFKPLDDSLPKASLARLVNLPTRRVRVLELLYQSVQPGWFSRYITSDWQPRKGLKAGAWLADLIEKSPWGEEYDCLIINQAVKIILIAAGSRYLLDGQLEALLNSM